MAGVRRTRVVVASTAGIFVESLDWTMYGLLAPYFAGQIFPGADPVTQVLGAYVVFAVGFVARPVGSFLMGRITDTRGRRTGLLVSVSLIAVGSAVIALAPTYAVAGGWAAAVVVAARVLQGVAMGGEVATAATYVVEVAPPARRHRYGAFAYSGDALGTLAATIVLAVLLGVLGADGVRDGGWRIAFAVAAVCGLLALWIRRGVPESEVFERARAAGVEPAGPLLRRHAGRMALAFMLTIGSTMGVYFGSVYLPEFAGHTGLYTEAEATSQHTVALACLLIAMIASGFLADRFGPLLLIRVGFTAAAVLVVPLMLALAAGVLPYVVAAPLFTICVGLQLGVTPVAGARLFPVPIRAVGLGVPAGAAIALFGGTFLFVAEWLIAQDALRLVPVYAAVGLTVSAVGSWLVSERLMYPVDTLAGTAAGHDEPAPAAHVPAVATPAPAPAPALPTSSPEA